MTTETKTKPTGGTRPAPNVEYRVTIATTVAPDFRVDFDDHFVTCASAEEARAYFRARCGAWQSVADVIAVADIPARREAEKAEAKRRFDLPENVARRAAEADRLERQRAGSRAANARRRLAAPILIS